MSKRPSKPAPWTLDHLGQYLAKNPSAARGEALQVLEAPTAPAPGTAAAALGKLLKDEKHQEPKGFAAAALAQVMADRSPKGKKTSKINSLHAVIDSVTNARVDVRVAFDPEGRATELVLWFAGARLLTQNQLISALQKNIKGYFKYKKAWKTKMILARRLIHAEHPCQFLDPVLIEVLRHGTRLVDRDSLSPQFKILIDELRYCTSGTKNPAILLEDHPEAVVDVIPFQRQVRKGDAGFRGVGMRVVACPNWSPPEPPDPLRDWLGYPDLHTDPPLP